MLSRMSKTKRLLDYIEREKNAYPQVFESDPDTLLFVMDTRGKIVSIRGSYAHFWGSALDASVGKRLTDWIYQDDVDQVKHNLEQALKGETLQVQYRMYDDRENIFHLDVTFIPIVDESEVIGIYGVMHDASEKQKLLGTRDVLKSFIRHSREIICVLDQSGTFIFESPSMNNVLGYTKNEIIGKKIIDFIHPDDLPYIRNKFDAVLKSPEVSLMVELRVHHVNKEWKDFEITMTNHLDNPDIEGVVCNFHDVTDLKRKQKEVHHMSVHDYLTELPNRRAFEDRLDLEIRLANTDQRMFAVMFLNLDGFKFLNDSLGHDIGDDLLIKIARRLNRNLHKHIEMLARIGGDEFAILTTSIQDLASVEKIANEVLQSFTESFVIKGYQLSVTTSVDISVYPESGEDTSTLMKSADLVLYLAKKRGNNHYEIFSPTASIGTYKLFTLRNGLAQALQNEEFELYYQPIVHTKTKQIVSVEALIRWNHPEWGVVMPNEFIPLAEESGLIVEIGEWVLRTVCKKIREWHEAGYYVQAAVNLSLIQFLQADLIPMIQAVLNENELSPKWLNIEVTESTVIEQEEEFLEKIEQFRALGIQISLDDFGTGYSSYQKLKEMKPDVLKLDRSIIKDVLVDQDTAKIVESMIQLAHNLALIVVAEGVETKDQEAYLASLEVDYIQGYFYSPPVSVENIEKLIKGQYEEEQPSAETEEKRKFFRVDFPYPLEAVMTISKLNDKKVQMGNTKVLIGNIGPGGLMFISKIKFPPNSGMELNFKIGLFGEELDLFGRIVYVNEVDQLYRYGVQFIVDESIREELVKHFNQLQLRLKDQPLIEGLALIVEDMKSYFRKK